MQESTTQTIWNTDLETMTFTNNFEEILVRYGSDVIWRRRIEGNKDKRGHPTITRTEIPIRAFIHENSGNEQLILGQTIKNYDAFLLSSKKYDIKEGDEILWHNKAYRISDVIQNISHIECHLKKVEA